MQAYKFNTVIEKGMIHIPMEIQNKLSSQIEVIIYAKNSANNLIKQNFSAMKLNTQNFKFNREDANER